MPGRPSPPSPHFNPPAPRPEPVYVNPTPQPVHVNPTPIHVDPHTEPIHIDPHPIHDQPIVHFGPEHFGPHYDPYHPIFIDNYLSYGSISLGQVAYVNFHGSDVPSK